MPPTPDTKYFERLFRIKYYNWFYLQETVQNLSCRKSMQGGSESQDTSQRFTDDCVENVRNTCDFAYKTTRRGNDKVWSSGNTVKNISSDQHQSRVEQMGYPLPATLPNNGDIE